MEDAVKVLKALSNDTRLKMVQLLSEQPLCVNMLVCRLDISQPAVSQHLKVLENAGLVKGDKHGYWVHYRLVTENLRKCAAFVQELTEEVNKECVKETPNAATKGKTPGRAARSK